MKSFVRAAALALAALLSAGSLASCGPFGGGKKLPDKQIVDHVYKYEQKKVYSTKRTSSNTVAGYEDVYDYAANEYGYIFLVQKRDKDYNLVSSEVHFGGYDGDSEQVVALETPQSAEESVYYQTLSLFEDGFGVIKETGFVDPETESYQWSRQFDVYGADGTLQSSLDLAQALGIADGEDSWFSVDRVLERDGALYLLCETDNGTACYRLGTDGTLGDPLSVFPEDTHGYVQNLFFSGENELTATAWIYDTNNSKNVLITLDLTTGARTEIDTKNDYRVVNSLFADAAGNLYCTDSNGIYAVDRTTLEKTELMNYINSDYIYNSGSFTALPDGRFASFTSSYDYDSASETSQQDFFVNTFVKVPDSEILPKYIITVASAGYAYNFQEQIVKFNVASDEYRIKYVDYSQYNTDEDYTLGETRLGDDILAGNVPDVLIADNGFSVSKYLNKKLFADLYAFMDKDEDIGREDFLENILTGCEVDGKLYEIPTNFYIQGLMGPQDKLAAYKNLTLREFADKVAALPEGVSFFREGDMNREGMLQQLFLANYADFVDVKTGKCSINNDEFRALLEYVKSFPEKTMWEQDDFNYDNFDWDAYNNAYRDGRAIARLTSISSFSSLADYSYDFGEEVGALDFIGVPSPNRDGLGFSTANLKFLISAKGAFPDAAWNFVKIFLSDEYQREQSWGFPVNKTALEAMKQETLDEIKRREEENNDDEDMLGVVDGPIAIEPGYGGRDLTAEDVEAVYNCVLTAKKQLVNDTDLFDIINEETSAYFAGTKSLDEILPLMESRINIVLAEGR